MTTLTTWMREFDTVEKACPWPGPRPLTETDVASGELEVAQVLVGRGRDIKKFVAAVVRHSVVVLAGDSGVGKSSLVDAGLIPELRLQGFEVFVCRWEGAGHGSEAPEDVIADEIALQLTSAGITVRSEHSLADELDLKQGSKRVLVLDQLEELIRYREGTFERLLGWIARVADANRFHLVLSLRAEYLHRLQRLDTMVRPYAMTRILLEPVGDPSDIRELVENGNRKVRAIETGAVESLVSWWTTVTEGGATRFGLLHMQAILYVLYFDSDGLITKEHADALLRAWRDDPAGPLSAAAEVKLERCSELAMRLTDKQTAHATIGLVRAIAPHLSSGGYKTPISDVDLLFRVLRRELSVLGLPPAHVLTVFRVLRRKSDPHEESGGALLDLLRSELPALRGKASVNSAEFQQLGLDHSPWVLDPGQASSGVMLGMAPDDVLVEQLRRFTFALVWLRQCALIRAIPVDSLMSMVTLIHDGHGSALSLWAFSGGRDSMSGNVSISAAEAVASLTALRGERLWWQTNDGKPDIPPEFDGGEAFVYVLNVRWRDCIVTSGFRRVIFVNCDFSGSRFESCQFEGVTFINCLMDNSSFGDCEIVGNVGNLPRKRGVPGLDPAFEISVSPEMMASFAKYRESEFNGTEILSLISGVPALPTSTVTDTVVEWTPVRDGFAMYGGRLSSLTFRSCRFQHDGISFRHIVGSSLDFVEQDGGGMDIFDCLIRGLTVSSPSIDTSPDAVGQQSRIPLSVMVADSVLANTWLGDGVVGLLHAHRCHVWALTNFADGTLKVLLDLTFYANVVNASVTDSCQELEDFSLSGINHRESYLPMASVMDFTSAPAERQLRARLAHQANQQGGRRFAE